MRAADKSTTASTGTLLVCNCQRTMEVDAAALARALGSSAPLTVHSELCRGQAGAFEQALAKGGPLQVACTQEATLFAELAEAAGHGDAALTFTDIRERAGWCAAKAGATPKMAALLAEAAYVSKPTGLITLKSDGVCLVYGEGPAALEAATTLGRRLSVTLLLTNAGDMLPPARVTVPITTGRIRTLKGHLGAFEIEVDGYAAALPSSRGRLDFALARNGAKSRCDVILDMSGRAPLIADASRRDGYLRADPANPAAVARAMLEISDLVGEFEKPLYVDYDAGICAHARSQKVGCARCLEVCPTGAITPHGDHVAIDPALCGGCGSCSAVCPTGAVSYALPRREDVMGRVRVLLDSYLRAGGRRPVLLLHDEAHGDPLISAMARLGRGLPTNVLPMTLNTVLGLGHDQLASMLAAGADAVVVLAPPGKPHELPPLQSQVALTAAFLTALGYQGPRIHVLAEPDPDIVEAALYALPALAAMPPHAFAAGAGKRELARVALAKLNEAAPARQDVIPLPAGAPYGRIQIDTQGCTLCLACVAACPANALADHPERPQVAFTEAACVQCGLCSATCPEKVITLAPRYDFTPAALGPTVLNSEEPFHCVRCAKPFGTKATIGRVVERLKGHAMFQSEQQIRLIQMCDTCRIETLAEQGGDPFAGAARPQVRTTADYVAAEAEAKKTGRKPEDFLS